MYSRPKECRPPPQIVAGVLQSTTCLEFIVEGPGRARFRNPFFIVLVNQALIQLRISEPGSSNPSIPQNFPGRLRCFTQHVAWRRSKEKASFLGKLDQLLRLIQAC